MAKHLLRALKALCWNVSSDELLADAYFMAEGADGAAASPLSAKHAEELPMVNLPDPASIGAVAAPVGALLLLASTLLHPLGADPADAPAAFAEYAADPHYVWTHLGQFAGFFGLGIGLVALASTLEHGRAFAWGRVSAAGAVASIAVAAMLQAVDGVALKAMADRWVAADGEARLAAYEAAFAVRQIEIGLAGFLSVLSGLTLIATGIAILLSARYPAWLGVVGLLDGLGLLAAGVAQASTGFSAAAMTLSMAASSVFLVWAPLAGLLMWRVSPSRSDDKWTRATRS